MLPHIDMIPLPHLTLKHDIELPRLLPRRAYRWVFEVELRRQMLKELVGAFLFEMKLDEEVTAEKVTDVTTILVE